MLATGNRCHACLIVNGVSLHRSSSVIIVVVVVMHLSIVCPTIPCTGRGGGIQGILLDLTSKTRPRGGAIDTPLVAIEQSIAHAL